MKQRTWGAIIGIVVVTIFWVAFEIILGMLHKKTYLGSQILVPAALNGALVGIFFGHKRAIILVLGGFVGMGVGVLCDCGHLIITGVAGNSCDPSGVFVFATFIGIGVSCLIRDWRHVEKDNHYQ